MATSNKREKSMIQYSETTIIEPDIDLANHPYFVEKLERAKESVEKYGLPEELLNPKKK